MQDERTALACGRIAEVRARVRSASAANYRTGPGVETDGAKMSAAMRAFAATDGGTSTIARYVDICGPLLAAMGADHGGLAHLGGNLRCATRRAAQGLSSFCGHRELYVFHEAYDAGAKAPSLCAG